MGTRHLTMVIDQKGKTKIAQYGQWDGYPSGQGTTVLKFLKNPKNIDKLKAKFPMIRFATVQDKKEIDDFMKSIGSKDGWMTGDQADKYHQKYPLLTRDNGAEILNMLLKINENVFIMNQTEFAGDSLFCEWAYVIDLKKKVLEVYTGFNCKPLPKRARFKILEKFMKETDKYYPIRLVKKWSLNDLPNLRTFIKELTSSNEE